VERHEENIKMEVKAGIKKDYVSLNPFRGTNMGNTLN
jgi:hypothetical protein